MKERFLQLSLRSVALLGVMVLALIILGIVSVQKSCDRRLEQLEDEKIKAYDAEIVERLEVFQRYIELANKDHETTTAILDAMNGMNRNINQLAENDKTITARVDKMSQNEYRQARSQKNNQADVKSGRMKTPAKPLRRREIDALKTDAQLYPNGN